MTAMAKLLLKTENLKQYFQVASKGIFNKIPTYLKANNGINIEIYEGETFGLVGESGCGKSTLGRVILQLYKQDRGNTIYYGRSIFDLRPSYVGRYLDDLVKKYNNSKKLLADSQTKNSQLMFDNAIRELSVLQHLAGEFLLGDLAQAAPLLKEEYQLKAKAANGEAYDADRLAEVEAQLAAISETLKPEPEYEFYRNQRDGGVELSLLSYNEMRFLRRDMQIIFQDPYSSLNPRMTIGQIIGEAVVAHGLYKEGSKELEDYILETMDKCGLERSYIHRYPHQFSGGQRQRIGIARALALRPKFIVCDEAVSALDVSIQAQILKLLEELKRKEGLTYLFISHDLGVINNICDRIAVMYFGNIVELGVTDDIFDNPIHPYTKMLLSAIPSLEERGVTIIENAEYSVENSEVSSRRRYCHDELQTIVAEMTEVEPGHFYLEVDPDADKDVSKIEVA